jgi:serine/threonine-protein kinase HipA
MRCYGCLKDIDKGLYYCPKCKSNLFDGKNVKPLNFNKTYFYRVRSEMSDKMSISGVQDKISLSFNSNNELTPTNKDGKYILKPIPRDHDNTINLEDIVQNEHLSMQISSQIFNINTAHNGLIEFSDGELAYITKRFDYSLKDSEKKIVKADQEDFASVLEYTSESHSKNYKYESSYEECALKIKEVIAAYIPALEEFYKRIVLNYLIGNADAHLKNFSIIRDVNRTDYSLSPNYDILFTKYHLPKEDGIMGLQLFKEYETKAFGAMGYYTLEDFEVFAEIIGIKQKRLKKIYDDILKSQKQVYALIDRSYMSNKAKEAYKENYENRLKKCLFYVIETYPFRSFAQETIKKYL